MYTCWEKFANVWIRVVHVMSRYGILFRVSTPGLELRREFQEGFINMEICIRYSYAYVRANPTRSVLSCMRCDLVALPALPW